MVARKRKEVVKGLTSETKPLGIVMLDQRHNWMQVKEKLKRKFDLTYDELAFEEGQKDEMLARLEIKLNLSKEQLRSIIAAL